MSQTTAWVTLQGASSPVEPGHAATTSAAIEPAHTLPLTVRIEMEFTLTGRTVFQFELTATENKPSVSVGFGGLIQIFVEAPDKDIAHVFQSQSWNVASSATQLPAGFTTSGGANGQLLAANGVRPVVDPNPMAVYTKPGLKLRMGAYGYGSEVAGVVESFFVRGSAYQLRARLIYD